MRNIKYIILLIIGVFFFASCNDSSKPNYRYFSDTDMYESVSYETYQETQAFRNGTEAQFPPLGTIKRGWKPYKYANTNEGYQQSKLNDKNPLEFNDGNLSRGKELYNIYCAICHGVKGDGQGELVKREKFLGIPNYKDRDITEGSINYVIYYGLNSMGAHAGQISEKERWQVAMYVHQLRNNLLK